MASAAINKIRQIVRLKQVMHRWRHSTTRRHVTTNGTLPLEVGPERRRFVVPARFVNLPILISLLNQAHEEFGYQPTGVLSLPSCDPDLFQVIIDFLEIDEEKYGGFEIEEFIKFASDYYCKESSRFSSGGDAQGKPLLQKA